jgi:hypothetical protein
MSEVQIEETISANYRMEQVEVIFLDLKAPNLQLLLIIQLVDHSSIKDSKIN